jgi:ketosteroid isomerase-like protein
VVCTHPGWASLRGWAKVSASFFALFGHAQRLQFILTNERIEVGHELAWVSVDENILDSDGAATVAALNVFARRPNGRWAMVVHHASPVSPSTAVGDAASESEADDEGLDEQ